MRHAGPVVGMHEGGALDVSGTLAEFLAREDMRIYGRLSTVRTVTVAKTGQFVAKDCRLVSENAGQYPARATASRHETAKTSSTMRTGAL